MIRKLLVSVFALTAMLRLAGCSNNPSEPSTLQELNLEDEFGGYTALAESAGFGDTDLLEEAGKDEEFSDPMLLSPLVDSVVSDPHSGYYHLRVVWGKLRYDSTITRSTDWTGSLSVTRGVEIVRRVIHFEPGQDYILPRTEPSLIEWVSQTTVHHDGVAVDIFVPRPRPVYDTTRITVVDSLGDTTYEITVDTVLPPLEPVTVAFDTEPYRCEFALADLRALDTVVYLSDSNAVAFHALELHRYSCPRGFLAGHWGFDEDGNGRFRGVWMTHHGRITGYLRGHFGPNQAGANVFFGKWVSSDGSFNGFLKGIYGLTAGLGAVDADRRGAPGWFAGQIFNANRVAIGVLKGQYRSAPRYQRGFFQGRWKLFCRRHNLEPSDAEEGF